MKYDHKKLRDEIDFALAVLVKAVCQKFDIKEIHLDYTLASIYDQEATVVVSEEKDFFELKFLPHRDSWCLFAVSEPGIDEYRDGRSIIYALDLTDVYDIYTDVLIEIIDVAVSDGFVFI